MARYNDLIDRMDGFVIGTLIVDGDSAYLEKANGEPVALESAKSIELLNGDKYVAVSIEDCRTQRTEQGWPLFAGLYARVRF